MPDINLPAASGRLERFALSGTPIAIASPTRAFNRIALAAAHIVVDPLAGADPSASPVIDWDSTLAFRHHLLDLGFGLAEAMDTAQRGTDLDWPTARELIRRTLQSVSTRKDAVIFSGVGTEQLDPSTVQTLDDVERAYMEQLEAVQALGGRIILMASRALARAAKSPDDYARVYRKVLAAADQPVILHWLGEMFDPALAGYWGEGNFSRTMETCLAIINENTAKVDGIKISLLDAEKEVIMRRRLPKSVRMYTGDDFNYPELIEGDAHGFSHALLGIFDPIAPAASAALAALAAGDNSGFHAILDPTVPLSRLIFRSPTRFYKTGVVFLAWLNGYQKHFIMAGGQQSMRPLSYFTETFRRADGAGLLRDPDLAIERMRSLLALYGAD